MNKTKSCPVRTKNRLGLLALAVLIAGVALALSGCGSFKAAPHEVGAFKTSSDYAPKTYGTYTEAKKDITTQAALTAATVKNLEAKIDRLQATVDSFSRVAEAQVSEWEAKQAYSSCQRECDKTAPYPHAHKPAGMEWKDFDKVPWVDKANKAAAACREKCVLPPGIQEC